MREGVRGGGVREEGMNTQEVREGSYRLLQVKSRLNISLNLS